MNTNHIWNFSTVGGIKRVNIESGQDLIHLGSLDQKLWTALSCPVHDLEIDPKTLELIDTDKDGKIRVPEIVAAVNWVTSVIKNPDDLLKQEANFPISAINDQTEAGRKLLSSAKVILKNINKEDSEVLTVEETSDITKIFASSKFNGDGIITEDTTTDPKLIQLLNEVISCIGSSTDRGGKQGVSLEHLTSFLEQCKLYASWHEKADAYTTSIFPFGDQTEEAYQYYTAIKSKIDDYFLRCKLSAFDPRSTDVLNLLVARVEAISTKNLSTCIEEIAGYPLAKIEAKKDLPLDTGINPAWEATMNSFNKFIANKLFPNQKTLSEADWNVISDIFTAYVQWKSEAVGTLVAPLGIGRVREILASKHPEELKSLISEDIALEHEANNIILVDQLVRYYRDLYTLLKNFVTFYDFYSPDAKAIFQAGTLYIDQRSCDLCIRVIDLPKHYTMSTYSGMFLLYCECVSRISSEKMTIVAALTNGDIDNLVVGRNALFYDRYGRDWDATIIKIIDNPISIAQAFWSPYKKVYRFIETQINKIAAEQEANIDTKSTKSIEDTSTEIASTAAPKPPAQPFDVGKFVGIFAAIGLALGAIGSAAVSIVAGFMGLVWWKMPLAFIGLILVISGPPMVMAYLKLRKRNLAPLLDANGWAINARANVNIPFGNTLTSLANLPKGAKVNLNDPFTKKKRPYLSMVLILSILAGILFFILWKFGYIHLPGNMK
ncbi:hypothetical protein [Sporocytophaga myxococcoides]|uniref:hypothetical protein n=1 Tax=Sporocytophaga myxococcoides TaxID=153721 RepID=UPI0005EFC6B6|nr:hypothetical protein [Sporocytophaga myxococcoides]